jgi:hypothetical protein
VNGEWIYCLYESGGTGLSRPDADIMDVFLFSLASFLFFRCGFDRSARFFRVTHLSEVARDGVAARQ